ncbi:hypothetical protein [Pseudomonas sp. OIL-1]|uniref:hypothetical protein n=1 Tax=Pseudomonas sp. OIL-1 TaxID=2706126 RepID=UPI0013A7B509|nr:hypothetical protein [Pseudomonas sp. OIL-1]QIB52609.1 hypothetical protein G3M63_17100 [Pseudomonas sp. OIL-1]
MLDSVFILFSILILFGVALPYAKGTIISASEGYSSIWSFIFYKEVALIFMPLVLLSIYPVSSFSGLMMVEQGLVFQISLWVIYSFAVYFVLLIFLLRYLFKRAALEVAGSDMVSSAGRSKISLFSISSIVAGASLLLVAISFLGYEHAFFVSLITGKNLLHVRLENTYASSLPSQISYVVGFSCWVSAIFAAYLLFLRNKLGCLVVFVVGFVLATAGGAKGPAINYVILFVMAYMFFFRPKVSVVKFSIMFPIYAALISSLMFYVVSLQVPDLDLQRFWQYLVSRLGVGQMAGVYETLSIEFQNPEYAWHTIPFASFFVDYPIFSKELMLFTEGRDYSATGVKNSLFIAEAFGIGGYLLMAISPFIMAFAYLIRSFILFYALRWFFGDIVAKIYVLPILFLSTTLTGDFSSFVFQKGTILLFLALGLVFVTKILISPFVKFFRFA